MRIFHLEIFTSVFTILCQLIAYKDQWRNYTSLLTGVDTPQEFKVSFYNNCSFYHLMFDLYTNLYGRLSIFFILLITFLYILWQFSDGIYLKENVILILCSMKSDWQRKSSICSAAKFVTDATAVSLSAPKTVPNKIKTGWMKRIREICIYFCFNHLRYAFNRTLITHVLITSVPMTTSGFFNLVNSVS